VFRVARNVCLMQRRKSVFAPTAFEELPPDAGLAGDTSAPDVRLLDGELRAIIDRVIAGLPPLYRAVVLLRDRAELSTEETAQVLDVTVDVVKTRLHRGRAAMRAKLDCYVHNHCLEDQPSPNPKPLTDAERETLLSVWRGRAVT
jgi:RNA polymerase sigma-70 factor (ECF subfamily)